MQESAARVTVAPGATVAFDVAGEPVTAIAETNVTRVDPLRR